jgi:uncharacterized protein
VRESAKAAALLVLVVCTATRSSGISSQPADSGLHRNRTNIKLSDPVRSSFYLAMRDGVKIAADLYLPKGLRAGQKIPTILVQTRYGRSLELRAPLKWVFRPGPGYAATFIEHGYAWIETDVRGSGASFGNIPYPWSPDEISDGNEIVNWIVRQPWSNGQVGALGVSYDGVDALLLTANHNPAVRAVAPLFGFWDIYLAAPFPGGIYLAWFIPRWSRLDRIVDQDTVWKMARYHWYTPLVLGGIAPVDGPDGPALLRAAVAEHNNVDVAKFLSSVVYRSDVPSETAGLLDGFTIAARSYAERTFSRGLGIVELSDPARYKSQIEDSHVPLRFFAGWYDGATTRGELQALLDLNNPRAIIIGPWIHAITRNIETGQHFDTGTELLRFFDQHLKGTGRLVAAEPLVTYYTMVEGKWKTAAQWPLPSQRTASWYLALNHMLSAVKPVGTHASDSYRVDYRAGTGHHSRWEPLVGTEFSGGSSVLDYGNRREADEKLLVYQTAPLSKETEVTGHPAVTLYVTSTASDGEFFAYLEDVAVDGRVTYVTEGELRAIDRKLMKSDEPFCTIVPCHSFMRADREPLVPGEVAEIKFDLYPISYLFRRGHSIRLALAGADRDHFAFFPGAPPVVRFERSASYPSRVDLPVIPHH